MHSPDLPAATIEFALQRARGTAVLMRVRTLPPGRLEAWFVGGTLPTIVGVNQCPTGVWTTLRSGAPPLVLPVVGVEPLCGTSFVPGLLDTAPNRGAGMEAGRGWLIGEELIADRTSFLLRVYLTGRESEVSETLLDCVEVARRREEFTEFALAAVLFRVVEGALHAPSAG